MNQQVFLIFGTTSILLLTGLSVAVRYLPQGFFDLSLAISFTLGAYGVLFLHKLHAVNLPLAIALSVLITSLVAAILEGCIYSPIRRMGAASWMLLIASLGIYIVFENLLSLGFGDAIRTIRPGIVKVSRQIGGAYLSDIQITTMIASIGILVGAIVFLRFSPLGRAIRGVASNPDLSTILGINAERMRLWSVAISGAVGAIAGILFAMDSDMAPTMGFPLLMNGVVVVIVGGLGSVGGLIGGAFIVAAVQNEVAYYFNTKWMDAAAFGLLITFLIWKPLGFSGRRLKKVEV